MSHTADILSQTIESKITNYVRAVRESIKKFFQFLSLFKYQYKNAIKFGLLAYIVFKNIKNVCIRKNKVIF